MQWFFLIIGVAVYCFGAGYSFGEVIGSHRESPGYYGWIEYFIEFFFVVFWPIPKLIELWVWLKKRLAKR